MTIYYDIREGAGEVDIYDWNGNYYETQQIPPGGVEIPPDMLAYLRDQFEQFFAAGNVDVALRILAHAAFEDWEEGTPP